LVFFPWMLINVFDKPFLFSCLAGLYVLITWLTTSHQKILINWMKKRGNFMLRVVHHYRLLSP